jgi:hypothetical protein
VDVTGIEPVTPCLQNSSARFCNPRHFNHSIENSKLSPSVRVWLDVLKCGSLHVGSLQKSLQSSTLHRGTNQSPDERHLNYNRRKNKKAAFVSGIAQKGPLPKIHISRRGVIAEISLAHKCASLASKRNVCGHSLGISPSVLTRRWLNKFIEFPMTNRVQSNIE